MRARQMEDKMKTNIAKRRIIGAVLMLVAIAGLTIADASTASAQERNRYYQPNWQSDRDRDHGRYDRDDWRRDRERIDSIARENGNRDGFRQGQEDRFRHRRFDYDNSFKFRDALSGYRGEFGNRDFYRQAYREAFRRGYENGFRSGGARWPF